MHLALTAALLCLVIVCVSSQSSQCTLQNCGDFRYSEIPKYYRGLFKTGYQIAREDALWAHYHQRRFGNNFASFLARIFHPVYTTNHDYDQCCPTTLSHTNPQTMTNVNGIVRTLLHLDQLDPPQYQWIPNAQCSSAPHFCSGICRVETITLTILVLNFDTNPPFEFDSFNVPAYCSCKSS